MEVSLAGVCMVNSRQQKLVCTVQHISRLDGSPYPANAWLTQYGTTKAKVKAAEPILTPSLQTIMAEALSQAEKSPAWLFTITNNTVPGHERSSVNRGTSTSKCTTARGWKSDWPHFRKISAVNGLNACEQVDAVWDSSECSVSLKETRCLS